MNTDNKRFFMVAYIAASHTGFANGNHFIQTDGEFINNKDIIIYLENKLDYIKKGTIVINNIFEFKSESDFNEFIR